MQRQQQSLKSLGRERANMSALEVSKKEGGWSDRPVLSMKSLMNPTGGFIKDSRKLLEGSEQARGRLRHVLWKPTLGVVGRVECTEQTQTGRQGGQLVRHGQRRGDEDLEGSLQLQPALDSQKSSLECLWVSHIPTPYPTPLTIKIHVSAWLGYSNLIKY